MGLFDSLFGGATNKSLKQATATANTATSAAQNNAAGLLTNAAGNARTDLSGGVASALQSLLAGYGQGSSDLTNYAGQAAGAIGSGVNQAVDTVQGSNAAFQPFAATGTAANGMLGNALGLNGAAGNAAATSAFQASPGYQFQVDQATDAAARKAASLGMAASGNTMSAITGLAGNLANQEQGSWLDRLQGLASQGLSAAGSISGNNQAAGNYQYGGGGILANLLSQTGQSLATGDRALGTAQAGLQSGLGTAQASLDTGLGTALANNTWQGTNAINSANLGTAQQQDKVDSTNNGNFSKLLLGTPGTSDGGIAGSLLSGFRSGFKL